MPATLVAYVAAILLCAGALMCAFSLGMWWVTGKAGPPFVGLARRIDEARDARRAPPPREFPDDLAISLRRLGSELRRVADSDLPAKSVRMQALTQAYDDVLLKCVRSVGLSTDLRSPLGPQQRFELEARLIDAGFRW